MSATFQWLWRGVMSTAFAGLFLALPVQVSAAKAASLANPSVQDRLVDAEWLKQHRAQVVLLDASPTPAYRAGHIPGAISADRYVHGAQDPTRQQMTERLRAWGVDAGEKIVIYDQGADFMAPRLFYDLYYHGVPAANIFLLDGGMSRWRAAGGTVSQQAPPAPRPGSISLGATREAARVRLPEFLLASGDRKNHVLLDALSPSYYYGERGFFDRNGHVPGAVLMPSEDFFNADKTFKSAAEMQRLLRYAGIQPAQTVHSHCGGGGAAAVPWFALSFIAGHTRVKLYQESQFEWLQDDRGLPFWTYSAPQLMREASWLAGWNSPMLRAFGAIRLNIVDVRSPEAYARDHVPFALSLPAATFRQHLQQPERLAALLGPTGVNADEEVVIVSDGGLTPDAALAFVVFEQLGQRKVSVLMNSVDDWGLSGKPLTKEATRVGQPGQPGELSVPAARYAMQAGPKVVVADPGTTTGEFPKLFVATGRAAPARLPDGPVVRLPYVDLLGADGRPKPAAELNKIIAAAKVPRHAELILFADDSAEAAIGYYVLRLMGWPDLKLWAK